MGPKPTSPAFTKTILVAIAALGATFALPAAADERAPAASREAVAYTDLDLTTHGGARTLLSRLHYAARNVCGPAPSHSPLFPRETAQHDACVASAVDTAVAAINAPLVVALHTNTNPSAGTVLAAR